MVYNKLLKWKHVDTDSGDENEKGMPGFPIFLENELMRDILLWRLSTCIIIWSREWGYVLLSIDTFHNIKIKVYPHLKTSIEGETTNYPIVQWMRWKQVNNQGFIDFRRTNIEEWMEANSNKQVHVHLQQVEILKEIKID